MLGNPCPSWAISVCVSRMGTRIGNRDLRGNQRYHQSTHSAGLAQNPQTLEEILAIRDAITLRFNLAVHQRQAITLAAKGGWVEQNCNCRPAQM